MEVRRDELARLAEDSGALIARWFQELADRPVCPAHDPAELAALVDEPLPERGAAAEQVLAEFERLLPYATAIPSPRYYGLLNPAPTPVSVWAEALAAAVNPNLGAWRHGTIGVAVEERVIRWLVDLYGFPPAASGTFTSGGTEANLTAAACARHRADPTIRELGARGAPLVGYVSREGHFSLDRSFDLLGLGRSSLRAIDSDESCRIRVAELRERIAADRAAGLRPFFLVGILGTTSTGAVDPLPELARVAREERLWFHVDAAYGGPAALSPQLAPLCAGVELADSVTVDPHKWLFVPFSAGAIVVREGG
ncbi:MAG: aspartate aminotransferase family protein, partial [Gemmatimonadota bacterium]